MGMTCTFHRVSAAQWDELEADPDQAVEFLMSVPGLEDAALEELLRDPARAMEYFTARASDPARVDLDKDWHALHFLLTEDPSLEGPPLSDEPIHQVVLGGTPTDVEGSYGPVRKFSGETLRAVARAIQAVSWDDLRCRFSADAFNDAGIYPCAFDSRWCEDELAGLAENYPRLQRLFADAAAADEVVLIALM